MDEAGSLPQIAIALGAIEKDVASIDEYVDYCTKKYKPFSFNLQAFAND